MELFNREIPLNKSLTYKDSNGDGVLDTITYGVKDHIIQIPLTHKFDDIGFYDIYEEPPIEVFDILDVINTNIPKDNIEQPTKDPDLQENVWSDGVINSLDDGVSNIIKYCTDVNSPNYEILYENVMNSDGEMCYLFSSKEKVEPINLEEIEVTDRLYCPKTNYTLSGGTSNGFCNAAVDYDGNKCEDSDGNPIDCDDIFEGEQTVTENELVYSEFVLKSNFVLNSALSEIDNKCKLQQKSDCSRGLLETDIPKDKREESYGMSFSDNEGVLLRFGYDIEDKFIFSEDGQQQLRYSRVKSFCYSEFDAINMDRPCHYNNWLDGEDCEELINGETTPSVTGNNSDVTEKICGPQ